MYFEVFRLSTNMEKKLNADEHCDLIYSERFLMQRFNNDQLIKLQWTPLNVERLTEYYKWDHR